VALSYPLARLQESLQIKSNKYLLFEGKRKATKGEREPIYSIT